MSKQSIVEQLQENIKIIYHKAVDADKHLMVMRSQEKATFSKVFTEETIFRQHASTFLPYVEELAADLQAIETDSEDSYQKRLPEIVLKIELLFKTLNSLKLIEK